MPTYTPPQKNVNAGKDEDVKLVRTGAKELSIWAETTKFYGKVTVNGKPLGAVGGAGGDGDGGDGGGSSGSGDLGN